MVHDRLTDGNLWSLFEDANEKLAHEEASEDDWDDEDLSEDDEIDENKLVQIRQMLERSTPRQVFARLSAELPPERRLTKIGETDQPLSADVYLRPRHNHVNRVNGTS